MTKSISTFSSPIRTWNRVVVPLLPSLFIQLLSFGIYLHPLTSAPIPSSSSSLPQTHQPSSSPKIWTLIYNPRPQLDELHILSVENHDISPPPPPPPPPTQLLQPWTQSWRNAWNNDYWGRPLSSDSSHKSWRPISVWSFRFLKGGNVGRKVIGMIGKFVGRLMDPFFGYDHDRYGRHYNIQTSRLVKEEEEEEWSLPSELFIHRFINVVIHAAIVQLVGTVAVLLFRDYSDDGNNNDDNDANETYISHRQSIGYYTKIVSQLLFSIHPTHVEAVVNAANRPHILALLFNLTIVDPTSVHIFVMTILSIFGLLAAETAIFHYPAIIITMTAIRYRELQIKTSNSIMAEKEERVPTEEEQTSTCTSSSSTLSSLSSSSTPSILLEAITTLLPRYALLGLISGTYLTYRYCNNTLSIPDGLIRPAENPFYDKAYSNEYSTTSWTWKWRLINYSYILSLHIMKSFGVEIVGYSHEYGYDCIPEISYQSHRRDWRLALPITLTVVLGMTFMWSWYGDEMFRKVKTRINSCSEQKGDKERTERILYCFVFLSWMATLFPISGILKVGTFVADRIVIASTVGTCIFIGRGIALGILNNNSNNQNDGGDDDTNNNDDDDDVRNECPQSSNTKRTAAKAVSKPMKKPSATITNYHFFPFAIFCVGVQYFIRQTHQRASEWMDSLTLFESSLKACPRSTKSHLEMSKLYSGLVPHMFDLEKALYHIDMAFSIDPTYCDVHQQYAHVYFQQEKYIDFEEETVQALLCKFTMAQAMNNWNRYWKVVLSSSADTERKHQYRESKNNNNNNIVSATDRYNKFIKRIQDAVARAENMEEEKDGVKIEQSRRRRRWSNGENLLSTVKEL